MWGETRNSRENCRAYLKVARDISIIMLSWTVCSYETTHNRNLVRVTSLCLFRDWSEVNDSAIQEMSSYLEFSGEASATFTLISTPR
jgi:hypothetical protein